jgi:predicted TIM-barrel fold metal-dependent hydrolase
VQDYADAPAVVAALDVAGMDVAVWQGEYYRQHASCVARNRRVQQAMRQAPTRLHAFVVVQPNHPGACEEIARGVAAGMCGVGELSPAAQGFSLRDVGFLRCAEYCARHAIPMLLHVNEPVGLAYPGKVDIPLADCYEVAARFPELRLILAHWGGGLFFYEMMPNVARTLANVYYDTAAGSLIYPDTAKIVQVALTVAPQKIMFGSDFPLKLPPTQPATVAWYVQQIQTSLPVQWHDAWFGATAQHVLFGDKKISARIDVPPLVIRGATSVVALVEQIPAADTILLRWGITVTAHTPWWHTIAHEMMMAGHSPADLDKLLQQLHELS